MEQQLAHYQIEKLLGEGSFAAVYRAFDQKFERLVALKVLKPVWQSDPQAVQRFDREAKTVARLRHPHIIDVYDVGQAGGQLYLAQLLVAGETLAARLQRERLAWAEMLALLQPLASALDYAHGQGIIHRDLKPSNILLDQDGTVFLGDFGLVRAAEGSAALSTSAGGMIGTPAYMAPEQWQGQPATAATDVYALSCIVVEMLTGQVLFDGSTPAMAVYQHTVAGPTLPTRWPADVPAGLNRLLEQALAREPADRYQTAGALGQALTELSQTAGRTTPRVAPGEKGRDPTGPAPRPRPKPLPKSGLGRLKSASILGIVGLMVFLCCSLAWWQLRPSFQNQLAETTGPTVVSPAPAGESRAQDDQPLTGQAAAADSLAVAPVAAPTNTATPTPTGTATFPPTASLTPTRQPPTKTPTPTPTGTPTRTSTPTLQPPTMTPTPRPALEAGSTRVREADDMTMVYVPAGTFTMGSDDSDALAQDDEKPAHAVTLDAFWLDRTEVTVAMFEQFTQRTGYETTAEQEGSGWVYSSSAGVWQVTDGADWRHPFGPDSEAGTDHPVVQVSWDDAVAYCDWAGGRLPTEAEWEYAARGPDSLLYPWGNAFDGTKLNFCDANCDFVWKDDSVDDGYRYTAPVGSYPGGASWVGARDMAGNVWEWVQSKYQDYPYRADDGRENLDSTNVRVLRGGGWHGRGRYVRAANRGYGYPYNRVASIRFSVCGVARQLNCWAAGC